MKNEGKIIGRLVSIQKTYEADGKLGAEVILQVDDSQIPVSFFAGEKKTDGSPSKTYPAFIKFMENAQSAEQTGDINTASMVEAKMTSLGENIFSPDGTATVSFNKLNANFFEIKAIAEPVAEINVAGIILGIVDVIKDDVPTGEVILGIEHTNVFNGKAYTQQLKLNVTNPAHVTYVKANYQNGLEAVFTVKPTMVTETITTVIGSGGFGAEITETKEVKTKRFEVIAGGAAVEPSVAADMLAQGRAERNARVEQAKTKAKNKGSAPSSGKSAEAPKFTL